MRFACLIPVLLAMSSECHRIVGVVTEHSICSVKHACVDCLRLPQCSWCGLSNLCYSKHLTTLDDFCPNDTIDHKDYGFSLEDNAKCSCSSDDMEQNCSPPGVTQECSDRGTCMCGRCVCDPHPDIDNPTKKIMGQYCEFDNFSCDGPKCNEGPYSILDPEMNLNQERTLDDEFP